MAHIWKFCATQTSYKNRTHVNTLLPLVNFFLKVSIGPQLISCAFQRLFRISGHTPYSCTSCYTISAHLVNRPARSHFKAHSRQIPLSTLTIWRCISIMSLEGKPEQIIPFSPGAYCFDQVFCLIYQTPRFKKIHIITQHPEDLTQNQLFGVLVLAVTSQNMYI